MDIRIEPFILKVDKSTKYCPCCGGVLLKEIKLGEYLIRECGYCRYLDRPFAFCGNTASNHYGGCECNYGEKEFIYITCKKCISPKCNKYHLIWLN